MASKRPGAGGDRGEAAGAENALGCKVILKLRMLLIDSKGEADSGRVTGFAEYLLLEWKGWSLMMSVFEVILKRATEHGFL